MVYPIFVAYVNLGASLMASGRLSEAASALRAGARVSGVRVRDRREHDAARVSALVQLASLHTSRSHWHKALSSYKEALQILPKTNAPIVGWTRHFSFSRPSCVDPNVCGTKSLFNAFGSWLRSHEEAQVMLASLLVVVGIWWLVRAVLSLMINLVCPVLFVFMAVMFVPQLRSPLLGQNYPLLAKLLKNILLNLAEKINV